MDANGREYLAGEPKVLECAGPAAFLVPPTPLKAAQNRRTPKRKRVAKKKPNFNTVKLRLMSCAVTGGTASFGNEFQHNARRKL
jgi:hypothetical protein